MEESPTVFDIGEFARSFMWGLMHWNRSEEISRLILTHLLGDTKPVLAVVSDLGNRNINHGLRSAMREIEDSKNRALVEHFLIGTERLLSYRNLYVHNIKSFVPNDRKAGIVHLIGRVEQLKGEGRLSSVSKIVEQEDIDRFKGSCEELSRFGTALLIKLDP